MSTEFEAMMKAIHAKADELLAMYQAHPSREMSLAVTNLEQSCMWATKALAIQQSKKGRIEVA